MVETLEIVIPFITVIGFYAALLKWVDSFIKPEGKKKIATLILESHNKIEVLETVEKSFINLFDKIFSPSFLYTTKFPNRPSIWKTSVFSILSLFVFTTYAWKELPILWLEYPYFIGIDSPPFWMMENYPNFLILTLIYVAIPGNYISICETRYILGKMENKRIAQKIMLLIIDVLLSGLIYIFFAFIFFRFIDNNFYYQLIMEDLYFRNESLSSIIKCVQIDANQDLVCRSIFPVFLTTYSTLIFALLYIAITTLAAFCLRIQKIRRIAEPYLKITERPIEYFGLLLLLIVALALLLASYIF